MARRPHALAVGASGMLAGACHGLAERGRQVTVVARDPRRLAAATAGAGARSAWRCAGSAAPRRRRLPRPGRRGTEGHGGGPRPAAARGRHRGSGGPLGLALCWIRGTAPQALAAVAVTESVADGGRIVHVLGSASRDPATLGSEAPR